MILTAVVATVREKDKSGSILWPIKNSFKDLLPHKSSEGPTGFFGSQKDRYRGTAGTKEGLSPIGRFRS